jgi:ferredoxin
MTHKAEWTTAEIDEILDELRPIAVPVNISIEGRQRILSLNEARHILDSAKLISLERCSCREKIGGCDGPLDVCVCADDEAKEAIEKRGAWETDLETAMDALMRAHKAGLVHLAYETRTTGIINIICSCCACCCHSLAAITRFGYDKEIIGHSDVIAVKDDSLCSNCGICVERCHFKAWGEVGDDVKLDQDRCAGCGVCASLCPEGAIRLEKRQ